MRKQLKRLDDNYTFDFLNRRLDIYIAELHSNDDMNKELSHKKIRNPIFPSDISENIAKFAIFKKYGIMPQWDTPKGDIIIQKFRLRWVINYITYLHSLLGAYIILPPVR